MALLGAFVQLLVDKLASASGEMLLNFFRREQIDTHQVMTEWPRTLLEIQEVLNDAEEKQITNKLVNLWLEELQDLAYDLDDILDEFATDKLSGESQASTSKRRKLTDFFTGRNPSGMESKVKEMTARLQKMSDQINKLGLRQVVAAAGTPIQRPYVPTTSVELEPVMYGRERNKDEIINLLLNEESNDNKFGVIPITGMGGIGKTTLAQAVYNDAKVKDQFVLKRWICVSDDFDIMRITKEIVGVDTSGSKTLDQVQVELKKTLAGKKFLIVLDDVWTKNYDEWIRVTSPFSEGAPGSKVIVTTRDSDVALMMGVVQCHALQPLQFEECWSIFAQHAFPNGISTNTNPNLELIGRKIVEKCGGLPLAARTLGGLLRCKDKENDWKNVLESKIWEIKESGILPALRLSYHHLPSHLKRCFAYCAILPKDYEFEEEELVFLWMAEGFIHQHESEKKVEDLGGEYFRELLSRSFFQPSGMTESSKFVMHDLINDLAQFVARNTCFRLEDKTVKDQEILKKARYSSYTQGSYDGVKKFEKFYKAEHLRTFLPLSLERFSYFSSYFYLTSHVPSELLPKLKCLRALSLSKYWIYELPNSIGDLKRLRYLNFSYTLIKSLPESVATLYNLQTLLLRGCKHLKKMPTSMESLIKLCHLDITDATSLEEMPLGIGGLESLKKLSNFIITEGKGIRLRELGNLTNLGGELEIKGLQNVVDPLDARMANLSNKDRLEVLSMVWSVECEDLQSKRVGQEVLDGLRPHHNLKELQILFYHGSRFPTWIGDRKFSNMECICLRDCKNCVSLPPFGQLRSLKKLVIKGMSNVKLVGSEFYGQGCSKPFPVLKILSFENMPDWEDWSSYGGNAQVRTFPCLIELHLKLCPKLSGTLPNDLPCLRTLEIEKCPMLLLEVPSLVLPSLIPTSMADVPFPSLPLLLGTRNKLEPTSFLKSLDSREHSIPNTLCDPGETDDVELVNVASNHLSSLTSFRCSHIKNLRFLPKWFFEGLRGLERLEINDCDELTTLWKNVVILEHCLPALQHLCIIKCPQLVSLFEEEEEEEMQLQQKQREGLSFMMRLESLKLGHCDKLEMLPRGLHTLPFLGELTINNCPSLVSFPEKGLPSTLRNLYIYNCEALQSLPEWIAHTNYKLEVLRVSHCPALQYVISPSGRLPPTLKLLVISFCTMLESLVAEEGMKINCPSLESFEITECFKLRFIPDALHNDSNLKNLNRFVIRRLDSLESIPEGWFSLPTNLREIHIEENEKLEALPLPLQLQQPHCLETNNNLFTSLEALEVDGLRSSILKKISFDRLSSLRELNIRGRLGEEGEEDAEVEVEVELSLPTSLIKLHLCGLTYLETQYSREFQKLTSLQELVIFSCNRLASIPKEGLPPSLQRLGIWFCDEFTSIPEQGGLPPSLLHLRIEFCPKFGSFPEKGGLPPSLLSLYIEGCPMVKSGCKKGKGKYWPLIRHIPLVEIDRRSIFGSDEEE